MIELILITVLSTSTSLFLYLYAKQRQANINIVSNTVQFLLRQELDKKENKTDKEKANEDFLKFVSDSRDWAYQYIEDVQKGLDKFITDLEPEISYFDEYGIVGSAFPHYHSMKKISGAYKELKKLLPEDYDRIE